MAFVTIDAKAFLASWKVMREAMDKGARKAFDRAVKDAWQQQQGFGYNNQTGRLTRSMKWKTAQRGAFAFTGQVTANAPYAEWVNDGTQPHKIPGPGKGPSVFFWPKVGRWVRFTSDKPANHPGTKAAGFTGAAAQAFLTTAPLVIGNAISKAGNKA